MKRLLETFVLFLSITVPTLSRRQTRAVAKATILGGKDIYIKSGSTLNLTCIVTPAPIYLFWYHNDKLISYDFRARMTITTEQVDDTFKSTLLVNNVNSFVSGNYSCNPTNAEMVSIMVHVLNMPSPCDHDNGGCSSTCLRSTNERGYSCACPSGIQLLSDNKTCAHEGQSLLLVANSRTIRITSLDASNLTDIEFRHLRIRSADVIDYDPVDGYIYWTDVSLTKISRAYLNGTGHEDIISHNLSHQTGMAIDYFGRKLYWTVWNRNRIEVSNLNGTNRKVLISNSTLWPFAIVVDPKAKRIYWSQITRKHTRIESCSLNGTDRSVFVDTDTPSPRILALDYENRKLYWGDTKRMTIEVANLDGSDRRVLISNDIEDIGGITILGDYVYWTDDRKNVVEKAHKMTGDQRQVIVDQLSDPAGLKAVVVRNFRREKTCKALWHYSFKDIRYDSKQEESFLAINEYRNGATATVTCKEGFELFPLHPTVTNAASTVCENELWKPEIINCTEARCSCTQLPREMIERKRKFKYCDTFVPSGTYDGWTECEEGYEAEGDYGARCAWGVWIIHTPETSYYKCNRKKSIKDCQLDLKSEVDLTALHGDKTFEGQLLDFAHGSTVKFTCKTFHSTLEGAKNATCIDGQWTNEKPKCKATSVIDTLHPPFLWVYVSTFDRINADDGRIIIPKQKPFIIFCWTPERRQLKLNERNVYENKSLKVIDYWENKFSSVRIIERVTEKADVAVECINSVGISTSLDIVIADTCEIDESELNRRGLQVTADSRQHIYVEEDKIQLECSSNKRRTDQFIMTCKSGREWTYANNMVC